MAGLVMADLVAWTKHADLSFIELLQDAEAGHACKVIGSLGVSCSLCRRACNLLCSAHVFACQLTRREVNVRAGTFVCVYVLHVCMGVVCVCVHVCMLCAHGCMCVCVFVRARAHAVCACVIT